MRFTVAWLKAAENRLADIWLAASEKAQISAAADAIDQALAANPLGIGEPRTAKIRYLEVPPLAVYYEVRLLDQLVVVRAVWRLPS